MAETHSDQEFLEFLIKALVDKPDAVMVDRRTDDMGVLLTLDIDPEDMGKVIGRMGNTAKAIRTLLRVVGMKNNARVNLKINEPEGGKRAPGGSSASEGMGGKIVDGVLHQDMDDVIADLKA
ncbi:MAG: hypothetical protein UY04_C0014G0025 [Parcubacteria group bacterium GW2011_GWA2_47_7]|nr:MAG: hypothetical protein UY04_C0014G0025 [Parcubacteria group bacterium GW2011_GWA2_47_7]